jgi:hypothetical protein
VARRWVIYTGVTIIGLSGSGLSESGVGFPIAFVSDTPVIVGDVEEMVTLVVIMPLDDIIPPEVVMLPEDIVPLEDIAPVDIIVPDEDIGLLMRVPVAEPEFMVVIIVPPPDPPV